MTPTGTNNFVAKSPGRRLLLGALLLALVGAAVFGGLRMTQQQSATATIIPRV